MAWPSGAVSTANVDATTDDPELAVVQIKESFDKLNQIIGHVSTFGQSLIDDADATAGRATLGLGTLATQSGTFSGTSSGTNTGDQTTISGNAGSATVLQTARNINGVSFNGSADITVPAAAGTLTGSVLAAGVTSSSLSVLGATVYIGDTSNAFNAGGLTINQGAGDDEILSMKSSDVAHGVTGNAETDTFGTFGKFSAASGGVNFAGFTESLVGMALRGVITTEDTGKATSALAAVMIIGHTKSGTGLASMGANSNIFAANQGSLTRFILDADGDSHQDVGTAWTNFDEHDDVALLDAIAVAVARPGDLLRDTFVAELQDRRAQIEALPGKAIVTFNEDGHHFVNMSRLVMLQHGAIRQLATRLSTMERGLLQ